MAHPLSQYISIHQQSGAAGGVETDWPPAPATLRYYVYSADDSLHTFKIFLPPGLDSINLNCGVGQGAGLYANYVARLGQPPTTNPGTGTSYGYTLAQLYASDCKGSNSGGYLKIAQDSGGSLPHTGQWLFVDLDLHTNLIDCVATLTVNQTTYEDWHTNDAVWDAYGDPIVGAIIPRNYAIIASSRAFSITWSPLGFYIPDTPQPTNKKLLANSGAFSLNLFNFTWRPAPIPISPFTTDSTEYLQSLITDQLSIPSWINEP